MLQLFTVIIIVALAALFLLRRYHRQMGGKNGEVVLSGGCSGCQGGCCQCHESHCFGLTRLDPPQSSKEV